MHSCQRRQKEPMQSQVTSLAQPRKDARRCDAVVQNELSSTTVQKATTTTPKKKKASGGMRRRGNHHDENSRRRGRQRPGRTHPRGRWTSTAKDATRRGRRDSRSGQSEASATAQEDAQHQLRHGCCRSQINSTAKDERDDKARRTAMADPVIMTGTAGEAKTTRRHRGKRAIEEKRCRRR